MAVEITHLWKICDDVVIRHNRRASGIHLLLGLVFWNVINFTVFLYIHAGLSDNQNDVSPKTLLVIEFIQLRGREPL